MTIWLDPGLTTGWASFSASGVFASGQSSFEELGAFLEQTAGMYGRDMAVGWESFIITPKTSQRKDGAWSLEVIGMCRWIALRSRCAILPSYPSSARSLGGERKLRALGWHKPGAAHANDAAQHLLSWLLSQRLLPDGLLRKILIAGEGVTPSDSFESSLHQL